MTKYRTFNDHLIESLKDKKEAKAFLDASIEEYLVDHDSKAFTLALRCIAEAQGGVTKLAQKTNLNKQNLYKILAGKTTPRLDTIFSIVKGLGYTFRVEQTVSTP